MKKFWIVCGDPATVGSHNPHTQYETLEEAKKLAESIVSHSSRASKMFVYELVGVVTVKKPVVWEEIVE